MEVILYLSAQSACSKWKRRKRREQFTWIFLSIVRNHTILFWAYSILKAVETQFKFIICPLNVNWKFLGYRRISTERKGIERSLLLIILVQCFTESINVSLLTWCSALLPLQIPVALFFPLAGEEQHMKNRGIEVKFLQVYSSANKKLPVLSASDHLENLFPFMCFPCTSL